MAERIGRFVESLTMESLPPAIVERARACFLNGYGIALGGLTTPFYRTAGSAALAMEGEVPNGATMLGDGRRISLGSAAFVNAALFHGRAQEDTCGTVHMGAIAIPLLTAMVEQHRYPSERVIPALVAAYEVSGIFDRPYGVKTAPVGLRASPLYGTLGAAAAAARLMGLDAERIGAALANAASFTGGILQSFSDGTDEWRYQVGVAARNGLTAAELARAGSVSAPNALEGKAGFVRAYVREDCDVESLLAPLGREWATARVTFKPYPVCAFNQTPVEAALAVRAKLEGRAPKKVRVRMNPYETSYAGMLEWGPFQTLSGTLMSIPFCIALTLEHGVPDMKRMTTFDDPGVAALSARTEVITDAEVPNLSTVIEVELEDGSRILHHQRMTAADYAYDRAGVSRLIRRIGQEQGVAPAIYDRLEAIVAELPKSEILGVVALFDAARAR
jgi:2-methylcitrate dehydratase PrpD